MKLKVDDIQFNLLLDQSAGSLKAKFRLEADWRNKTPVVFLHGFTGSSSDWQFIINQLPQKFFPIAIDLIGHGATDSPEDQNHYSCSAIVYQINSILSQLNIDKFIIAGYSMGGRAALSFCVKHPQKIIAAILESTTAGIEDITQKKERVELDLLFADKIKKDGVKAFVEFWFDTPLFEPLKKNPQFEQIKNERIKNSVTGLANTLTGFSTGLMNSYWNKLHTLDFPVLLISGELDEKYTKINRAMQSEFPKAQHSTVLQCGHNVHLEKPELFTKLVMNFLNSV